MKAALGETHPLVQLTLACLEYDQNYRPSAVVVLRGLEEVGTTLPQNCTQTKLELIQQVAVKEEEIQQEQLEVQRREIDRLSSSMSLQIPPREDQPQGSGQREMTVPKVLGPDKLCFLFILAS